MRRVLLIALLVAGAACAGAGIAVSDPFTAPTFGWTAYAPLASEVYRPNLTLLTWAPRIGAALLALGAGSTGAAIAALVLLRRRTR